MAVASLALEANCSFSSSAKIALTQTLTDKNTILPLS